MSEVIGDTRHLHSNRITFSAVQVVTGSKVSGHFELTTALGFKHLVTARASIRIVSESLQCMIIAPAGADKAVVAHIAVVPTGLPSYPSEAAHVMTIGGSAFCQHSVYSPASPVPLRFSQEVAHQIKPKPLVGLPPEIVYHIQVLGGDKSSETYVKISGEIEVDGIGFAQSW
nr:hypothetical protein [Erysiphe necator associated deltaflexivirus 4]